jgi:UDPglucose 6-dehydrogenase
VARIFVVGAGVVGTAVGRGFVETGHTVTLVDISPERVDALVGAGLDATTRLDLRGEPSSFVFLTVPTPAGQQGYDLRAMASASGDVGRAIGQALADRGAAGRHSSRRDVRAEHEGYAVHTVVTRSTVPPGTTSQLVGPAVAQASGTAEGAGFVLAANPEFLRGGSAEDDARWPWMTVVGARSRRVGERLAALFEPFGGELRLFDQPETAELVKCAHNLWNATKISFWNEMWQVAGRLGLDPDAVAGTVARSAEASRNPAYGIHGGAPFAGACLPKDADGFLAFARELGLPMPLLGSVVDVNRQLARHLAGGPDSGRDIDVAAQLDAELDAEMNAEMNAELDAELDVELDALTRTAGRVLDLRETERRARSRPATSASGARSTRHGSPPRDPFTGDLTFDGRGFDGRGFDGRGLDGRGFDGPGFDEPGLESGRDGAHVDLRYGSPDASGWYHGPAGPSRDAW